MQWVSDVAFQDAKTEVYVGAPTLLRLPNKDLLLAHNYYGRIPDLTLTAVHRSGDDGATWEKVTFLVGARWSSLFLHRGSVYLLGTRASYGDIVIRRSDDNGFTWTDPQDEYSGLLFPAGPGDEPPNYHCAATPVVEIAGRLYRAFEENSPLHWPRGFKSFVISCAADSDLLEAANWQMSNMLPYDQEADPPEWGRSGERGAGWLEGNIVPAPGGEIWNIMRVHSAPAVDRAAIIRVHEVGKEISFTPADFTQFPGGMSKFVIRQDPETGIYWALTNHNTNPAYPSQRNVLSVFASSGLRRWYHVRTLLKDDQQLSAAESVQQTAFQYPDWQFDGKHIIYATRTAYKGAFRWHDANRVTFGRVLFYRELTPHGLQKVGGTP